MQTCGTMNSTDIMDETLIMVALYFLFGNQEDVYMSEG